MCDEISCTGTGPRAREGSKINKKELIRISRNEKKNGKSENWTKRMILTKMKIFTERKNI
jgi:hypothetical protein